MPSIWDDIIAARMTRQLDPLAKRVLDNAGLRYMKAVRRGRPRKHPEKESAQAKRRREYLEECGRVEHGKP
jgi:hypothetical protein